jgi:drug/metabolite transporter (DMT)-like permease
MSSLALGLVLVAAIAHAGWNVLVKQVVDDRELLTWLALGAGGLVLAPALVRSWHPVLAAWPFVAASAVAEAVYVLLLTAAYQRGDLSVVYPVARGTAPLLLAAWTSLFLTQVPRAGGLAGICGLGIGVVMVASTADRRLAPEGVRALAGADPSAIAPLSSLPSRPRQWVDLLLILGVAFCISAYSVVDGAAMRHAPAAGYESAVFWLGAALTAPLVLRGERRARLAFVCRRRWRRVLIIGAAMGGGYVAVLTAFRLAPIAYVGATREVSIVIATLAGWHVLGERLSTLRLLGAVVIVFGIFLIVRFG